MVAEHPRKPQDTVAPCSSRAGTTSHIVMEVPVTAGVVAAVVAPVVTAVGAIAALANEWSIEVERREEPPSHEVTAVEGE